MASVGTLAAGVAHELNNPLAYVLGNLELLNQQLRATWVEPTQLQVLVDEALDGARRMRSITQDLRTFSQPHAEGGGLDRSADRARLGAEDRGHRDPAPRRAAARVRGRPRGAGRGQQAGAGVPQPRRQRRAGLAGGRGRAQRDPGAHVLRRAGVRGDRGLRHRTGDPPAPGLADLRAVRHHVPREVGTGLGLSICHNIVTSMGGHISVHRRSPRGTIFRVVLPPSGTPVAVTPTPAPVSLLPEVRGAGRRVLIIDDDPLVANSLRRLLATREVHIADSGRRGIEMLRENDRFEVVLCDLMMPEVSGMDVVRDHPRGASRHRGPLHLHDRRGLHRPRACLPRACEQPQAREALRRQDAAAARLGVRGGGPPTVGQRRGMPA